jgi:hypothetical protein
VICDKLNVLEHNLMREKDEYRSLVAQNNEINALYDENLRDKENKIRMIKDLREVEIDLEHKVRSI